MGIQGPLLYTTFETAMILGCNPSWLEDKARNLEIPHANLDGAINFGRKHIAEILFELRLGETADRADIPDREKERLIGEYRDYLQALPLISEHERSVIRRERRAG